MMTLQTTRLTLRRFQPRDADAVYALCNNENVTRTTLSLPYPYTYDDALYWIDAQQASFDDGKLYTFAITTHDDTVIGAISLSHQATHHHGELAYWIGEPHWQQGYGTEAAQAMLHFGFGTLKLRKVYARYFASNQASGRIMEKIGMIQEGVLRDHIYKNWRYEDLVCYGIVNS